MRNLFALAAAAVVAACGNVDRYEEGVYKYDPTYCYQSLGKVQCYKEPNHRDQYRLVNYYGPHPSRYDAPEEGPVGLTSKAPPPINFWVKDPEPVPRPLAKGDISDRPWLASDYQPPETQHASPAALNAFLRQAEDHLVKSITEDQRKRDVSAQLDASLDQDVEDAKGAKAAKTTTRRIAQKPSQRTVVDDVVFDAIPPSAADGN